MRNGYTTMHTVAVQVEAQHLETIAGFSGMNRRAQELIATLGDPGATRDAEALRWIVALAAAQIEELEA